MQRSCRRLERAFPVMGLAERHLGHGGPATRLGGPVATIREGRETELEIRAPNGGEPLLRGLVAGIVAGWAGEHG